MLKRCQLIAALGAVLGNFCLAGTVSAVTPGQLTVEIDGLSSQQGNICLTLFSRSEGFPSDSTKAIKASCMPITATPVILKWEGLDLGNYAIAVFHDENADGKLNTNRVGIPQEGFGFSNNPSILVGPPQFREATFLIAGQNTTIRIGLKYLLGS